MKTGKKRVVAKGDRLNWTPLKAVQPVKLSALQVKGHVLTNSDLIARHPHPSKFILVP